MNASSSTGSKWRPRCSRIICTPSSIENALRYTRSLVSASNTSATATMRPSIGIASPFRPRG